MEFLNELWLYLRERKKMWMIPLLSVLLLIGFLVVVAHGSAVAPFIYTIF